MQKSSTFAERLRNALDLKQVTKAELSRVTGISKSSLTHYVKGDWEGKRDNVYAIAKALNVNEEWLMGYDAPMVRPEYEHFCEVFKHANEENENFLVSHIGIIRGHNNSTNVGVSIHCHSTAERDDVQGVLLTTSMLSIAAQTEKISVLKDLAETFKSLPISKCKELLSYALFLVQTYNTQ